MAPTQKQLKVNVQDITWAMEDGSYDYNVHYLDTDSGEVISFTNEVSRAVEEEDLEGINIISDLQKDEIALAELVLADKSEKYIAIPKIDSNEGYEYMKKFADDVEDKELQKQLKVALDKKRPFRQFKDVLLNYPKEQKEWFVFKEQEIKKRIIDWLEDYSIEFT